MHIFNCENWFKSNKRSHSGDDSIEVPPVPIPNTEVKLYYAEQRVLINSGHPLFMRCEKSERKRGANGDRGNSFPCCCRVKVVGYNAPQG